MHQGYISHPCGQGWVPEKRAGSSQALSPQAACCPGWAGQRSGALLWQMSTSVTGSHVEMGPARTLSVPTTASASPGLWQHTTEIAWVSCSASVHPHWKADPWLERHHLWNKGSQPGDASSKTTSGDWKVVKHKFSKPLQLSGARGPFLELTLRLIRRRWPIQRGRWTVKARRW